VTSAIAIFGWASLNLTQDKLEELIDSHMGRCDPATLPGFSAARAHRKAVRCRELRFLPRAIPIFRMLSLLFPPSYTAPGPIKVRLTNSQCNAGYSSVQQWAHLEWERILHRQQGKQGKSGTQSSADGDRGGG